MIGWILSLHFHQAEATELVKTLVTGSCLSAFFSWGYSPWGHKESDTTEHWTQHQRKLTFPGTPHRLSAHRSVRSSLVCLQRSRGHQRQHARHGGLWAHSDGLIQLQNEQASSPHQLPGTAGLRVLSGAVAPACGLRWMQKKQEVKMKVSLPGWGQS